MVPFLVLSALAIDIASMNADQQRLQTGADAAALAVAQQCGHGTNCNTTSAQTTAGQLAGANDPMGGHAAAAVDLDTARGIVEVETSSTRDYLFGPVIGVESTDVSARGAAQWGYPTGGAHFPLAISWCEVLHFSRATPIYNAAGQVIGLDIPPTSGNVTIYAKSNRSSDFHACPSGTRFPPPPPSGPNGAAPAGGFSWLVESGTGTCAGLATTSGMWISSDTGNDRPDHCSAADVRSMIGTSMLLPVYDRTNGLTGSNAKYHIFGYIGFRLESFYFGSGYSSAPAAAEPCGNPARCIRGAIVEFVDLDDAMTISPSGPQFGASIVQLRLPEGG
ncbi:hypothetical protein GCM10022266_16970 [Agrococcus terreus]